MRDSTNRRRPSCQCQDNSAHRVVDLTPWFGDDDDDKSTTTRSSSDYDDDDKTSSQDEPSDHKNVSQQLLENLSGTGWSLVCLDTRRIAKRSSNVMDGSRSDSTISQLLSRHLKWPSMIHELFQETQQEQATDNTLVFRSFESGAPGAAIAEPKWSWEISTAHAHTAAAKTTTAQQSSHDCAVQQRMSIYALLLHAVAVSVRRALGMPKGLLVQEDMDGAAGSCCVDLLRAFYYHPTVLSHDDDVASACTSSRSLGSNPHTDWGSLTVVYQDDVGGLQTYCRTCGSWNDVPTTATVHKSTNPDSDHGYFVVHVGDITSLAILMTAMEQRPSHSTASAVPIKDAQSSATAIGFPSPLHRVVSPKLKPRVSLVYFCYPPADLSIQEIANELAEWLVAIDPTPASPSITHWRSIPYQDYYLLKDQSVDCCENDASVDDAARREFLRIANQPIRGILHGKWKQVQRD